MEVGRDQQSNGTLHGGVACDAKHDELAAYDEEIKVANCDYIILGLNGGVDENGAADTQIF